MAADESSVAPGATSARERQNLLFLLRKRSLTQWCRLLLAAQFPQTLEFRLQRRQPMCPDSRKIIARIGQPAAQELQLIRNLGDLLQQCRLLCQPSPAHMGYATKG